MLRSTTLILSAGAMTAGLVWLSSATQAGPGVNPTATMTAARTVAVTLASENSKHKYVGSNKCKMCHIKQYKSWKKTKMALAIDTLKPGHAADIKAKFNLDPKKDYSSDATCLKCHTTGYGHEGGYFIADAGDKKAVKKAKKLAGVGCESCHGPGSEYIKVFKDIFRSKRKYKVEELYAAGLTKLDANTCKTCHNDQAPTKPDEAFDFEKMKDKGTHKHFPLKQREN